MIKTVNSFVKLKKKKFLICAGIVFALIIVASLFFESFGDNKIFIETQDGREIMLNLEFADTPEKRSQGLMNRTAFEKDINGMLFVFEKNIRSGFWMKDTLMSLSIAFIDEAGEILEIKDMDPCPEDTLEGQCPLYFPEKEYRYALETEQGFFRENKVQPGDRVKGLQER